MPPPKLPGTEAMTVSEARRQFSDVLNRVRQREIRVRVEKSGIPVAGIVSVRDLAILEGQDSRRESQLAALNRYQAAFAGFTDIQNEIEIARELENIRQELREERVRERS